MLFEETNLSGLYVITDSPKEDERGNFSQIFCEELFYENGLESVFAQMNLVHNIKAHSFRGLHWQEVPYAQEKLVRCVKGSVVDIAVDIRRTSGSYCLYYSTVLSATNHKAIYIPAGFAHGYFTLENDTDVLYQVSTPHKPQSERGAMWNDPAFNLVLPAEIAVISNRDSNHPKWIK